MKYWSESESNCSWIYDAIVWRTNEKFIRIESAFRCSLVCSCEARHTAISFLYLGQFSLWVIVNHPCFEVVGLCYSLASTIYELYAGRQSTIKRLAIHSDAITEDCCWNDAVVLARCSEFFHREYPKTFSAVPQPIRYEQLQAHSKQPTDRHTKTIASAVFRRRLNSFRTAVLSYVLCKRNRIFLTTPNYISIRMRWVEKMKKIGMKMPIHFLQIIKVFPYTTISHPYQSGETATAKNKRPRKWKYLGKLVEITQKRQKKWEQILY